MLNRKKILAEQVIKQLILCYTYRLRQIMNRTLAKIHVLNVNFLDEKGLIFP